jgi:hypothetical protein
VEAFGLGAHYSLLTAVGPVLHKSIIRRDASTGMHGLIKPRVSENLRSDADVDNSADHDVAEPEP